VFLINSRLGRFTAAPSGFGREVLHPNGAPLLPKLRGNFAEFLNEGFLDRLGILYPPTCVGFGTGTRNLPRGFSRGHGFRDFRQTSPHPVSALMAGFRPAGLRGCPSTTNGWDPLSYPVLPSVITIPTWYGNINPLSIAYAFQPRLRSRLTLRRLALLRNPWAFGGGVSSPLFRYSCQHSHSRCLHGWVTPPLQSASGRSPTTPARPESAASVPDLSPATLSAREHLTSELLRTLSRVAASKPTSWLSVHSHIVYHLVRI
jgi:hypothetical protein